MSGAFPPKVVATGEGKTVMLAAHRPAAVSVYGLAG
jgi:hypothetical protein